MFHTARWKAYLQGIQQAGQEKEEAESPDNIYRTFHSHMMIWFVRDEAVSRHRQDAEDRIRECDALLADCTAMVDDLQERLARTPKPSEVLSWWW